MHPREFALRLARRCAVAKPGASPEFTAHLREAVSRRWTLDEAVTAWQASRSAEKALQGTPGGLGAWAEEWDACRRCGLHRTRSRVVHGRGSIPADVLVIGEGPGPEEDRKGEPFVGPAGFILDRGLGELTREPEPVSFYVANLVGCYMGEIRAPKAVEVEACSPRLRQIITAVSPVVLLLIGSQALYHLLNLGPLEDHRGKLLVWETEGLRVHAVATWHPAGILRTQEPARMRELRKDIQTVRRVVESFRAAMF